MKEITFYQLLQYHNQTVSAEEKKRIEKIIDSQPYYQEVLDGLVSLETNLEGKKEMADYLEKKKNPLKKRFFPKRSEGFRGQL